MICFIHMVKRSLTRARRVSAPIVREKESSLVANPTGLALSFSSPACTLRRPSCPPRPRARLLPLPVHTRVAPSSRTAPVRKAAPNGTPALPPRAHPCGAVSSRPCIQRRAAATASACRRAPPRQPARRAPPPPVMRKRWRPLSRMAMPRPCMHRAAETVASTLADGWLRPPLAPNDSHLPVTARLGGADNTH